MACQLYSRICHKGGSGKKECPEIDIHQILVYAEDVNVWRERIHTIKKNIEVSL
jgi:hypothetical protein